MQLIVILLGIIAISEITRLVLTHKKPSKKEHFLQKLEGTTKMIWDLEFKFFKTKEIREDIRKEYDNARAKLITLESEIERESQTGGLKERDLGEFKRLEDKKVLLERDKSRFEAQMKQLDAELYGLKPSAENHDGVQGITMDIDSFRELQGMLKNWIKHL